jgi:WD40 repeat protein
VRLKRGRTPRTASREEKDHDFATTAVAHDTGGAAHRPQRGPQTSRNRWIEATARVFGVVFAPDGKGLAWPAAMGRVWDAVSAQRCTLGQRGNVMRLAQLRRQTPRLGIDDATVRVWDAGEGKEVQSMKHGGTITGVAFSPDGFQGRRSR